MGKFWSHLAGDQYGQTHTVYPLEEDGDQAFAVWNHPLDVHLTCSSIQGWPRLIFQVRAFTATGVHVCPPTRVLMTTAGVRPSQNPRRATEK
jgi:hypothetical protein